MTAAIIVFPGSNRERDMRLALEASFGRAPVMVWHRETALPDVDLIVVPGGFSYGDYLRSGAMAAHSPIMREVKARAEAGVHVLGVCNGFQVLCETGLLPGALMRNASLKFICRDVHLRVERADTAFTGGYQKGDVMRVPVAHHDGNYFADTATLDRLEGEGQVAVRYCAPDGAITDAANPNGSQRSIAGVYNDRFNVLGMMPHPEDATHALLGGLGGKPLFDGMAGALKELKGAAA